MITKSERHEVQSSDDSITEKPTIVPLKDGGVTSAQGFRASAIHAGFKKKSDYLDLALVVCDHVCPTAAVFTQNVFCAAPVMVSREHLLSSRTTDGDKTDAVLEHQSVSEEMSETERCDGDHLSADSETSSPSWGYTQAMVINAGNANAATGEPGMQVARATASHTAELLGCDPVEVLVASTGVIGAVVDYDLFESNLSDLVEQADAAKGHDSAKAIMTTDTKPKEHAVTYVSADPDYEGMSFTVGGMSKGSGMIMPDMATMIAVLTTDAPLRPDDAYDLLKAASDVSFNKVSVDSDTSTNDTAVLMASGFGSGEDDASADGEVDGGLSSSSGAVDPLPFFAKGSIAYREFASALETVCINLARQIAADGEGATKLITVTIEGAFDDVDADRAARAIVNSPLVKTAIFGHDANWGRIAMALGKSGAHFKQENTSIDFVGLPVCRSGLAVAFDEDEALKRFEAPEVEIWVDLGAGTARTTMWTCDFSHDYITINGDYRS